VPIPARQAAPLPAQTKLSNRACGATYPAPSQPVPQGLRPTTQSSPTNTPATQLDPAKSCPGTTFTQLDDKTPA
jgi:hypothetical protein